MPISVNGLTKVITVPTSYMVLLQSTPSVIYQLDLNQFRLDLKAWEASPDGMGWPRTHNHNTTVTVGGATLARVVSFINDYTITFVDGQYRVETVGANSNIGAVTNVNQVSVSTSNSAGLQDLNSLQAASFGGEVAIKPSSIYSGTVFPVGTRGFPVNNLADAHTIVEDRGMHTFALMESITLATETVADGYTFVGDNVVKIVVTLDPSVNVTNAVFKDMTISGTLDGSNILRECEVGTINFFNGVISNCNLNGTITLGGGVEANIEDCRQGDSANPPTIDLGGTGQNLVMVGWRGGTFHISNCSDATRKHVIAGDGEVIIDSSVTAGTVEVYGDMKVVNNGTATVVDETSVALTSAGVWTQASRTLTAGVAPSAADIWAHTPRTLTDFSAVWSETPRTLTDSTSEIPVTLTLAGREIDLEYGQTAHISNIDHGTVGTPNSHVIDWTEQMLASDTIATTVYVITGGTNQGETNTSKTTQLDTASTAGADVAIQITMTTTAGDVHVRTWIVHTNP